MLTAIVIAFGLTAFALVLVLRGYTALGSADADALDMPAVPEPTPLAVAREETLAPDPHPASRAHDESVSPSAPPDVPPRPDTPPGPSSTLS